MTIEELRERKRELLARKKEELELQERGEGDNLSLFMVNEELLDVNAKLRALTPAHGRRGKQVSGQDWSLDRQQYREWLQTDQHDDDADPKRTALLAALREGRSLSARQAGFHTSEIAERLGVNPSTVSRTLERAVKRVRWDGEERLKAAVGARADLSDPAVMRRVVSALTETQAVYIFLYYSERLSLREVNELTGTDFSSISRTIRRGLARIQTELGKDTQVLEHMEVLDDVLFALYCQFEDQGGDAPPAVRRLVRRAKAAKRSEKNTEPPLPALRVETARLAGHGRLYQVLQERKGAGLTVVEWLRQLVRKWKTNRKRERI